MLQDEYPTLPKELLEKMLTCLTPTHGFNHPIPQQVNPITIPQQTNYTQHTTKFTKWNLASLNTALIGIQKLL
jgi:hypothetical protein